MDRFHFLAVHVGRPFGRRIALRLHARVGAVLGLRQVEEPPVPRAGVEDRRPPFRAAARQIHRLARFGERGLGRVAVGNRLIERLTQLDGRFVADLELHRQDSRHAGANEGGGDAGEGIGWRRLRPLAGVQHDEAQRLDVAKNHGEMLRLDLDAALLLVLEHQRAVLSLFVPLAMADEMQDMYFFLAEPPLQRRQRGRREHLEHHEIAPFELVQRLLQVLFLSIDIQAVEVRRARDDQQDPERRDNRQRNHRPQHVDVTDDWRLVREGDELAVVVVQELPGKICQLGHFDEPQIQPKPRDGVRVHLIEAAGEALAHPSGEDLRKEFFAECLGRGRVLAAAAGSPPGAPNLQQVQLELVRSEGSGEVLEGFTRRRAGDVRAVLALGAA